MQIINKSTNDVSSGNSYIIQTVGRGYFDRRLMRTDRISNYADRFWNSNQPGRVKMLTEFAELLVYVQFKTVLKEKKKIDLIEIWVELALPHISQCDLRLEGGGGLRLYWSERDGNRCNIFLLIILSMLIHKYTLNVKFLKKRFVT